MQSGGSATKGHRRVFKNGAYRVVQASVHFDSVSTLTPTLSVV